MNLQTLNVLVPFLPPLASWDENDRIPEGHGIELWKYVTQPKNISYRYSLYKDRHISKMFQLIENTTENDVLIMDTYINYDRHRTMSFSLPYASTSASLMSHLSNNCNDSSETFLPELNTEVILLTVVSFFFVAIILTSERWSAINKRLLIKIGENLLEPYRILLRQTIPREPRFLWTRIVALSYILGMLFFMLSYQNEMTVNMALCTGMAPDSLEQLEQVPMFRRKQLVVMHLVRKQFEITFPLKRAKYSRSSELDLSKSTDLYDLKTKLVDFQAVDLTFENSLLRTLTKICQNDNDILRAQDYGVEFHVGRSKYFPHPICLATRLGLPKEFMEYVNVRVLMYAATGLRQYMEKKRWFVLHTCLGPHFYSGTAKNDFNSKELHGLRLSSVSLCFTLWLIGLSIGLIFAAIERLANRRKFKVLG